MFSPHVKQFVVIFSCVLCADFVFLLILEPFLLDPKVFCFGSNGRNGSFAPYSCPKKHETCCDDGCCVKPFVASTISVLIVMNLILLCLFLGCIYSSCRKMFKRESPASGDTSSFDAVYFVETSDLLVDVSRNLPPSYSIAIQLPKAEAKPSQSLNRIPTYEEAVSASAIL